MKMGDVSPSDNQRQQLTNYSASCAPLASLTNVSVKNTNGFLSGLATLEKMVKDLPLGLPKNGHYVLEVQDNVLHIFGEAALIQQFEILDQGAKIRSLKQNLHGVRIELTMGKSSYAVELHYDIPSSIAQTVERTTSPWRSSQLDPTNESNGSESRPSIGSGER